MLTLMSPSEIVTLIGVLAAFAQLILSQLNYSQSCQRTLYISPIKQPPASYKISSKSELTKRLFSPNKVWTIGLLTLVIYELLGFHFAVVDANFWVWALAILINYWNLANLKRRKFYGCHENYLEKTLITAYIMASAVAVAGIVWASIENLPIYIPVVLGLVTGINSVVMMAMFTELFGRNKAVTRATSLSYSGFVLGWIVQTLAI
jgi:hypothetical protein